MKFTLTKQTLIGFTVFLTILILGSCGVAEDTAPPGGDPPGPQPDYMSFALTNLGDGALVDPTTPLYRGSNYRLTITPASNTTIPTADYTINHTPTDAITINVTRTNSVDFTINNTAGTTVTVTVTHKTDSSVSETLTLTLAPQADYMSFALTNLGGGALVNPTTQLSPGDGYRLLITRTSGTTPTADYVVTYTPATAIIIDTRLSNSVDFTVDTTPATSVTFTVTHRTNSAVSETLTLNLASAPSINTSFQTDIENATTVPNLILADALTREVLSPLSPSGSIRGGAVLVKRYVTTNGGATTQDGTSWATAWAATSLRANINAISDATANKVYLIMVAGATYKPTYANPGNRGDSFGMKNYVAIMGGFDPVGGWGRTGTTIFSGDIGTVGTTTDNSYHVFSHSSLTLNNAHLYGVTITNGNANGSNPQNLGGGMYNHTSSPVLTKVIFSGNSASAGGGMYNGASSPVLTKVIFSGNSASAGGGMYNNGSSSVLTGVVFSGNTTTGNGGGMYNFGLSPVLTRVVFSGNTATGNGGGMYNSSSSPVMIGAVFRNNRAVNGGGIANDNDGRLGPLIVNTIFSGNTLSGTGSGTNIAMRRDRSAVENIRIAGSVLGIGLTQPTNDIVGYNGTAALNIEYHSLANGVVNFGADANLTINGMNFLYPTITSGSAVNLGLHVRRSGTTYYFSEDESTWYTSFSATGGLVTVETPPGNATDLTATDIAGNARNARPDAGVYEVQ